jgi:gamma-polyglutamate biosynthesis protein CapA
MAFAGSFAVLESRTLVLRTLPGITKTFEPQRTATVLFVGDMMFDRHIRTVIERSGPGVILAGAAPLLAEADLNVGNLEGPITDNPSQSQGTKVGDLTNMRFTFSPTIRELLTKHRFGLVSIGNNHIRDFDDTGVHATTGYLSSAGIAYVGDPTGASAEPVIREIEGVRIAFVAYSDFVAGDADRARHAIAAAEGQGDVTVVLAHWGSEYETEPSPRVRELARSFVDAGADLIIGTHSHVIGAVEDIGGARVYYSLGNFVFDQYFEPSVRCGLAVKATLIKKEGATTIRFDETRIGMESSGQTVLGCR